MNTLTQKDKAILILQMDGEEKCKIEQVRSLGFSMKEISKLNQMIKSELKAIGL